MAELDSHTIINMLRDDVSELRQRLSAIDEHGTHYLPVMTEKALELGQQIISLAEKHDHDIARLENMIRNQADTQRATERWRLTFIIGLVTMLAAVATVFASLVAHGLL